MWFCSCKYWEEATIWPEILITHFYRIRCVYSIILYWLYLTIIHCKCCSFIHCITNKKNPVYHHLFSYRRWLRISYKRNIDIFLGTHTVSWIHETFPTELIDSGWNIMLRSQENKTSQCIHWEFFCGSALSCSLHSRGRSL